VSYCVICNESGAERPIEHEWGDWEKVEEECVERKICTRCREIGQERVSHTWGDWERVEGFGLERKFCVYCNEIGAERVADQKTYCDTCNGTGLVTLGGWNAATTCSVCGGSGVIKKYAEKNVVKEEN
ncbi:MAG: hypothetical protein LWX83_11405, partial [Anaerolineae bacterium]|nr:hypothetical protein [Anaerolineae bacterium]